MAIYGFFYVYQAGYHRPAFRPWRRHPRPTLWRRCSCEVQRPPGDLPRSREANVALIIYALGYYPLVI